MDDAIRTDGDAPRAVGVVVILARMRRRRDFTGTSVEVSAALLNPVVGHPTLIRNRLVRFERDAHATTTRDFLWRHVTTEATQQTVEHEGEHEKKLC